MTTAGDFCSHDVLTVREADTLQNGHRLLDGRKKCAIVVRDKRAGGKPMGIDGERVVGIVTLDDLVVARRIDFSRLAEIVRAREADFNAGFGTRRASIP